MNPRWRVADGFTRNGRVEPCEVLGQPYYYYGWAFSERSFECYVRDVPAAYLEDIPDRFKTELGASIPLNYTQELYAQFRQAVLARTKSMEAGLADGGAYWELLDTANTVAPLPQVNTRIPFLREGVERWYDREISHQFEAERAKIVLLHEELFESDGAYYHGKGRMNILYLDGHVESRVRSSDWWSQRFPLNEAGRILHDAVDGSLKRTPSPIE